MNIKIKGKTMSTRTLKNGIKTTIKINKNTPRTAIVIFFKINQISKTGLYYLMSNLLFQGTKQRSAEQLAQELDENAIEINFDTKADYIRFKILCLNEDINKALEIFQDMIENSTFDNYQKEAQKIKGEAIASLDSAKTTAQDNFYSALYQNHYYGRGNKDVIDEIENITKEELLSAFNEIKLKSQKNIFVAGDKSEEEIIPLLEKHLSVLKIQDSKDEKAQVLPLKENVIKTVKKEDANQAQIFQGWITNPIGREDYPAIILINTILGSSGLSSRLFLELREKQGLAYTVRSVYESFQFCGDFYVYIATEPKNIKTSINGFKQEMNKIMTEYVSDEELENAKNNAIGKRQFYQETNMLEAVLKGYYEFLGFDDNYEEKLIEKIKNTTKEDIKETAIKYFSMPSALCVLAPEAYLKDAKLI